MTLSRFGPLLLAGLYALTLAAQKAAPANDTDALAKAPFGGGGGRITRLGFQPVNMQVNFYGNAVHPSGASSWDMRIQIALLYPQKPKP